MNESVRSARRARKKPTPDTSRDGLHFPICRSSHSAGNLAAAQASGAYIDVFGASVHYGLDTFHVGLPFAVGAPVRVADLNTKSNTLVAELTLCHLLLHLLAKSISALFHQRASL